MSSNRKFVIGDIHGAYKALKQVLDKASFDYENDTLISLGDVSDHLPETAKVVEELLKIKNLIAIRGNHDVWVRDWMNTGVKDSSWLDNGGIETVKSYEETDVDIEIHRQFFNNQMDWHIDFGNRLYIHAGWDISKDNFENGANATSDDPYRPGIKFKACHWDRSLYNTVFNNRLEYTPPKELNCLSEFKEIFVGHTPSLNELPFNAFNFWGMDTGVSKGRVLTMMDVHSKEIFQSEPVNKLYAEFVIE